jgi:Protein O-mannosyl-transferase TMEM260-like
MLKYNRTNIILGWLSFAIALITYLLTLEPTVSWWDCGEFIATSYKLEVGHSPGAPFFMLLARFFTLFASGKEHVALMVNSLSALASAFTILFLFWTISHLVRKILIKDGKYTIEKTIIILGSAMVGALAYTFSDTFWFSAVEGEVYATSSLFTAAVFWAILKWENVADEKHADRWLILIAYLMGLSIGVHLLNLLAIPAIVLVYYFRRYPVTRAGTIKAFLFSIFLLGIVMYGIIQGFVFLASRVELLFVNGFGLPFNSGVIFYSILIISGIVWGIWYSQKKKQVLWNILILGVTVIILGYSSYAVIVIRSLANPPVDLNNPENVFSLHSYLNRESYGDRPLLTGHYYSDEIERDRNGYAVIKEKKRVYIKDTVNNKYKVAYRKVELSYSDGVKLFPRMYSTEDNHISAYKSWGGVKEGKKPNLGNNISFFLSYQFGHMYLRYFMWNFAGKQNDTQSHGSLVNGNWISGLRFIDNFRLGNQDFLPDKYNNQKSRNKYYLLPLIFGLVGLMFQYSKDKKDFWIVALLFFFTGIAIVIYLNQTPYQPRERDYAYAGSFYAFSIWIGLGVAGLYEGIKKSANSYIYALFLVLLSLVLVPGLMAKENYDDHNRSNRYTAREIARNYLNSCDENAILFTGGDNDTYPLWYAQEVEGIRTDVRVVNLMLFNAEWNIKQMRRLAYESARLPISLSDRHYMEGKNTSFYVMKDEMKRKIKLETIIRGIETDYKPFRQRTIRGDSLIVIPTNEFILPVDSMEVLKNGTVNRDNASEILSEIVWKVPDGQLLKSNMAQLDLLANFKWKRPIYFVTGGNDGALALDDYLQLDGLAYRLVPIYTPDRDFFELGRIDTEKLYQKYMKEFQWGGLGDRNVYLDYFNIRTISVIKLRKNFVRLADKLIEEGENEKAIKVLDRCIELTPNWQVPFDHYISGVVYPGNNNQPVRISGVIESYYNAGSTEKANSLLLEFAGILKQDVIFYESLKPRFKLRYSEEYYQSMGLLEECIGLAHKYGQEEIID